MKRTRYTESQIFRILKEAESGVAVPDLCCKHGVSDAGFYKWRARYGGMDVSNMTCLRELEEENRRLKTMYVESRMDCEILREAMAKKVVRPSHRKEMAAQAVADHGIAIKRACGLFSVSQTCYRYRARLSDDNARISDWLLRLTDVNRTWGFGLCFLWLRNIKGMPYNHKRVYRLYRELELNLRIKPKRAFEAGQAAGLGGTATG